MRNDDMQVLRDHVNLVHNPRLDSVYPRLDPHGRCCMCSRDRSRRT